MDSKNITDKQAKGLLQDVIFFFHLALNSIRMYEPCFQPFFTPKTRLTFHSRTEEKKSFR